MSTSEPGAIRGVAAFDFDGTLSQRDTLAPYLRTVVGTAALTVAMVATAPKLARAVLDDARRDDAKASLLRRLLAGRDAAALREVGNRYADEIVERRLRPDGLERLEWHREQGHDLVIVSASLTLYLDAVGARLGIDAVLASELEVAPNGLLSGELVGANVRRAEKVRRVETWLGERSVETWAYGDSAGDRELLEWADHPVAIGKFHR